MLGLYKFSWDIRRSGSISGLFFADDKEIEKAIGSKIDFGEALGKHSRVNGTLDEDDLDKLDISQSALIELKNADISSGYNPLNYIHCKECGVHEDECWCGRCTECEKLIENECECSGEQ